MNPYESPQTKASAEAILLREGLLANQIEQFCGYKACGAAGHKMALGINFLFLFYLVIYFVHQLELFDVRYFYITALYPMYLLLVGWLLNRQGLSLLERHASLAEARTNYRLCRYLSVAKLLTLLGCIAVMEFSLPRFLYFAIACCWPVWELVTILLQFSIIRDEGQSSPNAIAPGSSNYLVLGLAATFLSAIGLLTKIAAVLDVLVSIGDKAETIANIFLGTAFFAYGQQLLLYSAMNQYLARTYLRSES